MARKPTLSPTKITTYLACPTKYMWTYLDPRGKWYLRSKSYYSFGTSLHAVLERFHDQGDAGVQTVDEALSAFEESWIDAGFASAEEMQEAYGEGKEILTRHVQTSLSRPPEAKTLFVEKQLKIEYPEYRLVGRLDRIDEFPDGTVEAVDYKSGRQTVVPEDVEGDLAMNIYQLLLARAYPGRPVSARILALRSGHSAAAALPLATLDAFEADLRGLCLEILHRDFEGHTPVPKDLCPRCDFLPLCSKHPDFDLSADKL